MTYEFAFRVIPEALFGVPEEGKTVLPATPGRQAVGPAIRTSAFTTFGHGTLSEYRKDSEALRFDLADSGLTLRVDDNYWILSAEAGELGEAYRAIKPVLDRLLHSLSVAFATPFRYEPKFVDASDNTTHRWPEPVEVVMIQTTFYNLAETRERIEQSFASCMHGDERLDRAYNYFESAILMREQALMLKTDKTASGMVWALAFLQLWKAITTILGDPSSSADRDYQSRFRTFGLPDDFWAREVDPLYRIRNQEDVAHYRLEPGTAVASFGNAVLVARRVVQAYAEYLRGQAPPA